MEPAIPPDRKKQILLMLVAALVALGFMGQFFWSFFRDFFRAQANGGSKLPLLIFGGFFVVMVLVMVVGVVRAIRRAASPPVVANRPADSKPWLLRPDWAAGRIQSATGAQWKIMLFMGVVFTGFGGFIASHALSQELHKGNYGVLVALVFPLAGIGMLIAVLRGRLAQRRYGNCFFEMASIPGVIGGTLEGMIQAGTRLKLAHGLHLKLTCLRRVATGSGDDRSTQETILWQDEKVFKAQTDLPEAEPGHSGIPVYFKIPAGQPECFARGNEAIVWRLEACAKMAGPNFAATFEVPVFQMAGATIVAADEPDPTAALQMPVEQLRRDENSKIQVTTGPGGREFYFPAARNLGSALMLTLFLAVWSFFLGMMIRFHAPILFPIVFGLFEVLMLWGCFSLWFKASRITINSSGVTTVNRWLIFSRTRQFNPGDIVRFDTKVGMTSAGKVFLDLKLITRVESDKLAARKARFQQMGEAQAMKFGASDPGGITVASGIPGKLEADWLVQEMTRALGRKI